MPFFIKLKPSCLQHQDLDTQTFSHLLWFYGLTDSEFSSLAKPAKPYPVYGVTYLPLFPRQLYCLSVCAHKVLGTILAARPKPAFT